jgi:hypothetical protein
MNQGWFFIKNFIAMIVMLFGIYGIICLAFVL